MVVISQSPTYTWPVRVQVPKDGGNYDEQTFEAQFKRLSQSRIKEIREQILAESITDHHLASEVLLGWRDVKDAKGADVPFSVTTRDELLDVPLVAAAIVTGFF